MAGSQNVVDDDTGDSSKGIHGQEGHMCAVVDSMALGQDHCSDAFGEEEAASCVLEAGKSGNHAVGLVRGVVLQVWKE